MPHTTEIDMRHTQGPWEAVTDRMYHDNPYLVVGAGAGDAKSVEWMPLYVQVGGRAGWVEQKANTLLIAAAPDLLSALVEAVDLIETISPMEGDTLRRARAAIEKAVGHNAKAVGPARSDGPTTSDGLCHTGEE